MSDYDEFEFLHQCATKIQKFFRGFMARQFYQQIKQLIYYHYQEKKEAIGYDLCFTEENQSDEYGFLQYKKDYLQQPLTNLDNSLHQQNYYLNEQTTINAKVSSQRQSSKQDSLIYKENNNSKSDSQVNLLRKRSKQTLSMESKINLKNKINEQDQVVFLTDVIPSSHDSLIEAYKENMMFMEEFKSKKTHNISNLSNRSELSVKIHQMSHKQTSNNSQRNQILSPIKRYNGVGQSPKRRPMIFEFDLYLDAAILIQKVYRGYMSRKKHGNYYRLKHAVLILESHLTGFLRRKTQQRRQDIKQMQVMSYNIQNQCRQMAKLRDQVNIQIKQTRYFSLQDVSNQKLQLNIMQTNQILYDSFLQLLSPGYQSKSQKQKLDCIERTKNFIINPTQNASMQEQISSQMYSGEQYNILQDKYLALKKTHKQYLENFIAQMKDVNYSQNNISSITKQNHSSSKSSVQSENNQNKINMPSTPKLTTKQFHSLLMKQQFKKKII